VEVLTDEHVTRITEYGWGGLDRSYQAFKDPDGHFHEGYWERGQAKPMDAAARHWVEAALRAARQAPTIPNAPPPIPPPRPTPPPFGPGEAGQEALQRVRNDARVIAMLSTPLTLDPKAKGSLQTWGPGDPPGFALFASGREAKADLTLTLHGPKGTALLLAKGERRRGTWSFSRLAIEPGPGGHPLDLLSR